MKLRCLVSFWAGELGFATVVGQEISCSAELAESLIKAGMAERIGAGKVEKTVVEETKEDESERSDAEPVVPAAKRKRVGVKRG